ncbi:hypothetical protein Pcinc_006054 [Petrolisthes cinctipes]|uniref:Crustin n=1 Tax=Petrolisthes cinctipes TaxID=88211 RepID=A0AAE1GBE6_PETCI|nr:hypothetical protein Pcinc_006054 [Petrolisthes cinctipes]
MVVEHTSRIKYMRMKGVFLLVVLVGVVSSQGPPVYPPGCPRAPPFNPASCVSWCDVPGAFGQYYCCDSRGSNPGRCPNIHLTPDELDLLCDSTQHNFPNHLNCKTDDDCFTIEKCCPAPHNNQYICRFAE